MVELSSECSSLHVCCGGNRQLVTHSCMARHVHMPNSENTNAV